MSRRQGNRVRSTGDNTVTIGQHIGNIIINLFAGPRGWNWPPFLTVVAFWMLAYVYRAEGPQSQLWLMYGTFIAAVALTVVRMLADTEKKALRAVVTMLALALTAFASARMLDLREKGDLLVTATTTIEPSTPLGDGGKSVVTVRAEAERSHLRLVLTVTDGAPGAQYCEPETTVDVGLAGRSEAEIPRARSGESVELALGGRTKTARALVTVRTSPGCLMRVSVTKAVLYD
ncbi:MULTISPECIES: hypothetical protein [unclassified Streptomyces]|uniref:hypothetical protein n=1 Tax=unclassified Streptomyces TaxID=2593676 RepID=UPI0032436F0C